MRKIPMQWIIIAGVVLAVFGLWLVRRDAYNKGKLDANEAPIRSAIKMGAVQVTADSAESDRLQKIIGVNAPKTTAKVEKYLNNRVKILSLPDSAALQMRLTNAFEADTAIGALMTLVSLHVQKEAADSVEKKDLRLQIARLQEFNKVLEKETHPLCGTKCGIAIGVVATGVLVFLLK